MTTPRIEGANWIIQTEVSANTWQSIGCSNTFSFNANSEKIAVQCDANGTAPLNFYGSQNYGFSLSGTQFFPTSEEETANFTAADFRAALKAKTKIKLRAVQTPVATGSVVETLTGCIIESVSTENSNGQVSTYSISGSADDYTTGTVPA